MLSDNIELCTVFNKHLAENEHTGPSHIKHEHTMDAHLHSKPPVPHFSILPSSSGAVLEALNIDSRDSIGEDMLEPFFL